MAPAQRRGRRRRAVVSCAILVVGGAAEAQTASTYCPPQRAPSPAVIVAPHGSYRAAETTRFAATALAQVGFAVVVVQPPKPGEDDYAARLAHVVDDVAAYGVAGCSTTGDTAVWGIGDGAFASLGLHGDHLRAIVALFVKMQCHFNDASCDGPVDVPTLVIEGEMRPARPNATFLDVVDARDCDLRADDDDCWSWIARQGSSAKRQGRMLELGRERRRQLIARSVEWMRSHIDGTFDAARWPHVASLDVVTDWKPPGRRSTRTLVSVPFDVGLSTRDRSLELGLRPELVIARLHDDAVDTVGPGWGIGLYGEILETRGPTLAGGGATLVHYGHQFGLAASLGAFSRGPDAGISVGLFAGLRGYLESATFDLPLGVRVDSRFAAGERTVVVSFQVDLISVALGIAELPALFLVGHPH